MDDGGLSDDVVRELARLFPHREKARQLLEHAGMALERQPAWQSASALEFWWETARQFRYGAVVDGPSRLIDAALKEWPENPLLRAVASGGGLTPPRPLAAPQPSGQPPAPVYRHPGTQPQYQQTASPVLGAASDLPERTAVVLTALGVEYRAAREQLEGPLSPGREVRGSVYEQGVFTGASGPWQVVLAQTGAGNTNAGIQLERAVTLYEPEVALFVGIAGGRKDVELGDVVAADKIYDYESGKETEGEHLPRIGTHQAAFRLVQWAQRVADDGDWRRRIRPSPPSRPPAAFVRPLAAGSVVVAHERAQVARLLDRNCGDALAVEMEGYGFLQGAYMNGAAALVVRGVSDLLSGKTGSHDELWQPIAARNAAAFAYELLSRLPSARG